MKKFLLLILICLSGLHSQAQTDSLLSQIGNPIRKTLSIPPSPYSHAGGIRLGFIRTNMENATAKNSFLFGLYYRFYLYKWYIEPSVNLAFYDTKLDGNRYSFSTVDIPVVVGRELFRSKNFRIYIYTGPVITIPSDNEENEDESILSKLNKSASTAKINLKAGAGLDISEFFTLHTEYTRIFHYYNSDIPANIFSVTFDINISIFQEIFREIF